VNGGAMDERRRFFEPEPTKNAFDGEDLARRCIESGTGALLLDADALPDEFFDLSSGAAGALLHRLTLYGIRLAGVVEEPTRHSSAFQDFMREANRGRQFRFFGSRAEAVAWLED
jgi:PadR family transcriptional regulator AphA